MKFIRGQDGTSIPPKRARLEEDYLLVGARHQMGQPEVERPEAQPRADEYDHGKSDQVSPRKPATIHAIARGYGAALRVVGPA